jgi:agmatine/peptidylarginine deiminase
MNKYIFTYIFTLLVSTSYSQSIIEQDTPMSKVEEQTAYEKHRNMSTAERRAYMKTHHPRVPHDVKKQLDLYKKKENTSAEVKKDISSPILTARSSKIPDDASFPGEWEEMQGVFVSWPYLSATLIDTVRSTPFADVWKMISYGVQLGGAKIYINIRAAKDSGAIKKYMVDKGYPLTNYRFLINPGDDIWARDFAHIPYYYDADDKMGWIDFTYYPDRKKDNLLPSKWAAQLGGINCKISAINWEGGNIIMNGMTNEIIGSDMVYELNSFYQSLSPAKVRDSIKEYLNTSLSNIKLVPYLKQEGGTGHIDLYLQRADEATIVYAKMPTEIANIPLDTVPTVIWEDYKIASANLDSFKALKTPIDAKSNYIFQTTLPKNDNNAWYQSGAEYETYTRTYSNSLIVNNVIVQPIFYDNKDGNKSWDDASIEKVKLAFPGYEIIPVDMRIFDGSGGSIHCVTKEYPAANPIRMFHYPYRDSFLYQAKFPVNATFKNQSGIDSSFVYYRLKGKTVWTKLFMTNTIDNNFFVNIPASNKGGEIIEYYLEAKSVNGKTMHKPMPAPKGFYTFKIRSNPNPINSSITTQLADIESIYPIPTSSTLYLSISNAQKSPIDIKVYGMDGRLVHSQSESKAFDKITLDLKHIQAGAYFVEIFVDGKSNGFRKIVKN